MKPNQANMADKAAGENKKQQENEANANEKANAADAKSGAKC